MAEAVTYRKLYRRVNEADEALERARSLGQEVDKVLVWRRHPGQYASSSPMVGGRDFFVDELLKDYAGKLVPPVSMPAEAPLVEVAVEAPVGEQLLPGSRTARLQNTSSLRRLSDRSG